MKIDLRSDPPPDLTLEVDVTHSSLDRLAICAAIGIPEVWRLEKQTVICHILGSDGKYAVSPTSKAFSGLCVADLSRFIALRGQVDANAIVRQFRDGCGSTFSARQNKGGHFYWIKCNSFP